MNAPSTIARSERLIYGLLALLVAGLWLASLGGRPLFNPDEGRYAEIPREMLAQGDWVIPHLNGLAYIEKPPLQYWATALSLQLFGNNEFAARLYTALCALGCLALVWLVAARLCGEGAAWRTAAVLSCMMLFLVLGQLLTLDMSLTLYLTLALAGFLLAQPHARSGTLAAGRAGLRGFARGEHAWMLVAWAATALAVLTKGLVGAVIPAAVLVLYSVVGRDWSPWRRLHIPSGLALFVAIAVPWHWLAARRHADFLQFFFVHEHFARYLTPSADREAPWYFFGIVLLLGSVPWTVSMLRSLALGWRRQSPRGEFDPLVFLWCWAGFVVVFFSLSDSKLIPYILPALPALAILAAVAPAKLLRREIFITAVLTLGAAAALALVAWRAPQLLAATERNALFAQLGRPLLHVALLLAVSAAFVLAQRRGLTHAAVFLSVGWCLAGLVMVRAATVVAPIYSGIDLVRGVPPPPPGTPLFSVATYDQTLPFYWRRTVQLVHYRGELDFGLQSAATAEIGSLEEFLARWQAAPDAYAVMERGMFDELSRGGTPMREVSRNVRHVLVARR